MNLFNKLIKQDYKENIEKPLSLHHIGKGQIKEYHAFSFHPFGYSLANAVAQKLKTTSLQISDTPYNQLTLLCKNGKYILAQYSTILKEDVTIGKWTEQEFIGWLAGQSERSMSLLYYMFNAHPINTKSLLWFLQEEYSLKETDKLIFLKQYELLEKQQQNDLSHLLISDIDEEIWGKSFMLELNGLLIDTPTQRATILDFVCLNETISLENEEHINPSSYANILHKDWYEISFEEASKMLEDALRYDLAYSSWEKCSTQKAQKIKEALLKDFEPENTFPDFIKALHFNQ